MKPLEAFQNLLVMAAADQKFKEEEVQFLACRARRWGISDEEFDQALRFVASGQSSLTIPQSAGDRRGMLGNLLRVMAVDGELAPVEKRLFAEAAARMDVSQDELDRLIDDLTVCGDPGRCECQTGSAASPDGQADPASLRNPH